MNIGEELVSAYLHHILGCEFIQTNLYTVETHGEIDVVGINLKTKNVYLCEVAIHLTTGLQYTKEKRPNNVQKLTEKFNRNINYATKYFIDLKPHYMLWSPIVKQKQSDEYNQMRHIQQIDQAIRARHGVAIDFIINERFLECLNQLRDWAARSSSDLKSPVMRLLQIEQHLQKHVDKLNA